MSDMNNARIVVFGAGALGSLIGGKLSVHRSVLLVGREAHIQAIRKNGLRIAGQSDLTVFPGERLQVETQLNTLEENDLVLLGVKAFQVGDAMRALSKAARCDGWINVVALQNGMGFENELTAAAGDRFRIVFAVSHVGATLAGAGQVEDWGGEVLLPDTDLGARILSWFGEAGMGARIHSDLDGCRWKKLAFNCALNAVSAILAVRNRETLFPEFAALRRAVLGEARMVAQTRGVYLPALKLLLAEFEDRTRSSNNVNSMWQDLVRGRKTEIEFLNGAISAMAAERGLATPANACLADWIRKLESAPATGCREEIRARAIEDLKALSAVEVGA